MLTMHSWGVGRHLFRPQLSLTSIFSDEATFLVSGTVNMLSFLIWGSENPRVTTTGEISANTWAEIEYYFDIL